MRTSPEASDLFRLLAAMRDRGARAVAMEVSSHALVQGRVKGARFDVALFTNLTRDHLDFHPDLESYFAAKRSLFDALKPGGLGVANLDDGYGRRLASELGLVAHLRLFGLWRRGRIPPASTSTARECAARSPLRAASCASVRRSSDATTSRTCWRRWPRRRRSGCRSRRCRAESKRPGRSPDAWSAVRAGQPFLAVVDYAHTDAALEAAIRSLRELTGTKVVVVFGCGGDRDQGKRPLMGKIAGDLADLPIATSDNPRSEDPLAILAAVEQGLKASTNRNYRIVPDRREAIRRAVAVAMGGGWSVLVAGKGHENEQIVGTQRLPFSDREELERAIVEQRGSEGRG